MASSDLNKVMLIGRLGQDPSSNQMPSGELAANFSLATSEKWKDRQSGEKRERTEWHRISTFGPLAKICVDYLRKGSQVYVEGVLRTRKWQDKQGVERFTTEVIANEVKMLGGKSDNAGGGGQGGAQSGNRTAAASKQSGGGQQRDSIDDDIPF